MRHALGNLFTLILTGSVAISVTSCSSFKERDKERTLQSKMIRALNEKTENFAGCAKNHNLFKALKQDRVRVEMDLSIGSAGKVEKFQIDNKPYPNTFVDCMFETAESISFPKLNKGETVQLTQPFIFNR